jgi:hypothetical protein
MWSQQQPAAALQEQELEAGAPPALPLVPTALLGGDLVVSRVVKGCWQLSGGHKGEADSDRTSGNAAVEVRVGRWLGGSREGGCLAR